VLLDGDTASLTAFIVMAALPAIAGLLIARAQGRSWLFSGVAAAVTLALALTVVTFKKALGH
jgi:hypothetical protein